MLQIQPTHTRHDLFEMCKKHCKQFCEVNNIPIPTIHNRNNTIYRGFYMPGKRPYIVVNLENTLTPRYNPTPRNQSFPNHKTDSTATGVTAHEVGHAVDYYFRTKRVYLVRQFKQLIGVEPQATSYDTTPLERVAEAMRIFILNPDLLKAGRPLAYSLLAAHLTPTVTDPWQNAYLPLPYAREKYIHWATGWILRGNKSKPPQSVPLFNL